jgi:hypothetical protein
MYSRQGWVLYHVGFLCDFGGDASDGLHPADGQEITM